MVTSEGVVSTISYAIGKIRTLRGFIKHTGYMFNNEIPSKDVENCKKINLSAEWTRKLITNADLRYEKPQESNSGSSFTTLSSVESFDNTIKRDLIKFKYFKDGKF